MADQIRNTVVAGLLVLLVGGGAWADIEETLSDGVLSVNGVTSGELEDFVLDGIDFTYGTAVQFQFLNGSQWTPTPSTWTVDPNGGPTGTYAIPSSDPEFGINVVTTVLDPLGAIPGATTRIVEQVLTFTNSSGGPQPLDTVSYIDNQVRGTFDDATGYDATTGAIYALDPTYPTSMMALIADAPGAARTWENMTWDDFKTEYDFENVFANTLMNNMDIIVGEDTVSLMGLDFGMVGAGESRTATFWYLVGDGITSVPSDFTLDTDNDNAAVPELATMLLFGGGLVGLAGFRKRFRKR